MRFHLSSTCLALLIATGCQADPESELGPPPEIKNHAVGHWTNKYSGNPDLAGVRVQQFPDCAYEAPGYEGRHPAMVIYVFKDGRANQIGYDPDGTIREDFWYKLAPDHYLWKTIEHVPLSVSAKAL